MCHYKCCHICIIQITGVSVRGSIWILSATLNLCVAVISSHLRCNIETLHFTPVICWTLDTGVRGERGEGEREGRETNLEPGICCQPIYHEHRPGTRRIQRKHWSRSSRRRGPPLVQPGCVPACDWSHRPWRHPGGGKCGSAVRLLSAGGGAWRLGRDGWRLQSCEQSRTAESYRECCDHQPLTCSSSDHHRLSVNLCQLDPFGN